MPARKILAAEKMGRLVKGNSDMRVSDKEEKSAKVALSDYLEGEAAEITALAINEVTTHNRQKVLKEDIVFAIKNHCSGLGADFAKDAANLSMIPSDEIKVGSVKRVMKKVKGSDLVSDDAALMLARYLTYASGRVTSAARGIAKNKNRSTIYAADIKLAASIAKGQVA